MATITLTAVKRTVLGKQNKKIRAAGKIPAVLYGHGLKTQSLELNEKEFLKAYKQAGESSLLSLNVDGKQLPVLINDVQYHYLNDNPIHVDFHAISMTEKLKAHIPLHFEGEAPAVKALGGVLVKNISEVEVECLPTDLPSNIVVDISNLSTFENVIRVSDLKVSDKVKVLAQPEDVVVKVAPPRSEEELKSLEETVTEDVTKVEGVVKPEAEPVTEAAESTDSK